jgi:hypothetical protein
MVEIRITSGEHKGRYIGLPLASGWGTEKNPPVNLPGTRYGLYAEEQAATKFSERDVGMVQSDLKALGYESELVEVK